MTILITTMPTTMTTLLIRSRTRTTPSHSCLGHILHSLTSTLCHGTEWITMLRLPTHTARVHVDLTSVALYVRAQVLRRQQFTHSDPGICGGEAGSQNAGAEPQWRKERLSCTEIRTERVSWSDFPFRGWAERKQYGGGGQVWLTGKYIPMLEAEFRRTED